MNECFIDHFSDDFNVSSNGNKDKSFFNSIWLWLLHVLTIHYVVTCSAYYRSYIQRIYHRKQTYFVMTISHRYHMRRIRSSRQITRIGISITSQVFIGFGDDFLSVKCIEAVLRVKGSLRAGSVNVTTKR